MTHNNKGLTAARQHNTATIGHSTGWLALKMTNAGGVMQTAEGKNQGLDDDICERFGGVHKFEELAFRTHAKMVHHPSLQHFFPETIDMEPITIKNARFMAGYFGGPEYGGPGVADAHSFLKITHEQYDAFLQIFEKEIRDMRCPDPEAVTKIIKGMKSLRREIVDRNAVRKTPAQKPGKRKGERAEAQVHQFAAKQSNEKSMKVQEVLKENFKCPYLMQLPSLPASDVDLDVLHGSIAVCPFLHKRTTLMDDARAETGRVVL